MCWPTRKPPPDVERLVFGQPAASASDRPSIVPRSFSFCSGNSDTARGVWSIVRYASDGSSRRVLLSRLRDCTPCKRMQCVVGLLPDTPVLLICCDRLSTRLAPVPRGPVARSAWRRLGLPVDAPPGVQALPRPALRVAGQLPTSVQGRCASHSGSTRSPNCRSQVPVWLSVPTTRSASVSAYRGRHYIKR